MKFPFKPIDLTHTLTAQTPSWDGDCGFKLETCLDYSSCTTEVKFRVQDIHMPAGIGTHMDAPAHCILDGKTVHELSFDELIAPCVVIDVSNEVTESYQLSTDSIHHFEQIYGEIEPQSFVIIRTGWDKYWDNPKQYRNNLQYPSISKDAAILLLERNIVGLGIDTLSPDTPESGYPVHQVILSAGKYIVENIANSNKLPTKGSFTLALPIPIEHGTEAPIRLVGLTNH